MNRTTPPFRRILVAAAASLLVLGGYACNNTPLIQPPECQPGLCDCDQDPTQPACRGYNDRPDGEVDPADANAGDTSVPPADSSMPDADDDAAEAGDDGGTE